MDQVGTIPRPNGLSDPVRIVKVTRGDDSWWAFAPSVVRQVDNWYSELGDNWIRELFPSRSGVPGRSGCSGISGWP
jgi:hypothetical protein